MLTEREQNVVHWLGKKKVACMKELRGQFGLSHMTVFRALKKYGYYSSYNYNALYYVLKDVPRFDEFGLWSFRNIRFSRYGSLPATIVALVENSAAGLTVRETEDRLQTKTANLLSGLCSQGRIARQKLIGHQVVYLARDGAQGNRQMMKRQELLKPPPSTLGTQPPPGCTAMEVIEVLKQIIISPDQNVLQLARRLKRRGVPVSAVTVQTIVKHYALKKKRRSTSRR